VGSSATVTSSRSTAAAADPWPLSVQLPLGALPSAVPCARAYARVVLDEWDQAALADQAELIVSELVTNSVQASTDRGGRPRYDEAGLPVVHLRLACDRARVLVEVWDSVPRPPVARRARPREEHGRGLALIEAMSDRWGWTRVPGWPGKVVWAELRCVGGLRPHLILIRNERWCFRAGSRHRGPSSTS
jgi:anti-sigma regulatory factor (Ser/Thr protein kinase)